MVVLTWSLHGFLKHQHSLAHHLPHSLVLVPLSQAFALKGSRDDHLWCYVGRSCTGYSETERRLIKAHFEFQTFFLPTRLQVPLWCKVKQQSICDVNIKSWQDERNFQQYKLYITVHFPRCTKMHEDRHTRHLGLLWCWQARRMLSVSLCEFWDG